MVYQWVVGYCVVQLFVVQVQVEVLVVGQWDIGGQVQGWVGGGIGVVLVQVVGGCFVGSDVDEVIVVVVVVVFDVELWIEGYWIQVDLCCIDGFGQGVM